MKGLGGLASRVASSPASSPTLTTPSLPDLMALAGRATALPSWSVSLRARMQGDYRAPLKGRGMEYAESRPYQAGDDVRALDWRLTARLGKPHTKLFREERERPVYVVVDLSPSMYFATRGAFKCVQAARAAALLAWKAVDVGDRIGGIVYSTNVHHELEPARGRLAGARFLKTIVNSAYSSPPESMHNAQASLTAMRRLRRLVKPGSLVFVITDARGYSDEALNELAGLTRHNEVGLLVVYDEFEAALPAPATTLKVTDAKNEFNLPAIDSAIRHAYAERFNTRSAAREKFCRERHLLHATLMSHEDPFGAVRRLLGVR